MNNFNNLGWAIFPIPSEIPSLFPVSRPICLTGYDTQIVSDSDENYMRLLEKYVARGGRVFRPLCSSS
jgi:hypothetical protein